MEKKQIQIIKICIFIISSLIFYWIFSPAVGEILSTLIYFISVLVTGLTGSLSVVILSPLLARILGVLPPELKEVLLFLILGNILLVVLFNLIRKKLLQKKNYLRIFAGVFVGALFRSFPITLAVNIREDITEEMRIFLGFPQFFAAIIGGVFLLLIIAILRKTNYLSEF